MPHAIEVYKFGGASLRNADAVRAMCDIVRTVPLAHRLVIVVSAMGKMTNALELALNAALHAPEQLQEAVEQIAAFHRSMVEQLSADGQGDYSAALQQLADLEILLTHLPNPSYDQVYDLVVPYGELISSLIVAAYLKEQLSVPVQWVDIRTVFRSNSEYRAATVNTAISEPLARQAFNSERPCIFVTQGFIAQGPEGATTTLGREGSDYSAALLGAFLQAKAVTIWKDVPGFLTADPALFPNASLLPELDYREAIEMANSGAKIVHPKALKPLQNACIPLYVRPFNQPNEQGSAICNLALHDGNPPTQIAIREGQVLLSLSPTDLSFALQDTLAEAFGILQTHQLRTNLIQASAISLSLSLDNDPTHLPPALSALQQLFHVAYNEGLRLITIRHYTPALRAELASIPGFLIRQETRTTLQYLVREKDWAEGYYPTLLEAI